MNLIEKNRSLVNEFGFSEDLLKNIHFRYDTEDRWDHEQCDHVPTKCFIFHVTPCRDLPNLSSLALSTEISLCRKNASGLLKEREKAQEEYDFYSQRLSECKDPDYIKKDLDALKRRTRSSFKVIDEKIALNNDREKVLTDFSAEIGVLDLVNEILENKSAKTRRSKP